MSGTSSRHLMHRPAEDLPGLLRALAAEPGRRIPVGGALNFRDVGGYPVAGGGQIGWRLLFRSDALHRLDPADLATLGSLGLRTVLDLRTGYEAELAPSPADGLAATGTLTMRVSLIGDDLTGLPAGLGEIYDYLIDSQGGAVAAAIRCLARPGGLPALVHCTAGKDRTGVVIALTLAAMGVPDHIVAADYALTSLFIDPEHTPTIGHVRESSGLGDRLTAALLASPPDLIMRTLARARRRGGSIEGYLAANGVTASELGALRAGLVRADGAG